MDNRFKEMEKIMNRSILEAKLMERLRFTWRDFSERLKTDYDVDFALSSLHEFSSRNIMYFEQYSDELSSTANFEFCLDQENGMNSPGILWDRLTILNCKLLLTDPSSKHHNKRLHGRNLNINSEISAVLDALHSAKPAKNILLAKEATERQSTIREVGASLWDLQSSNLAMWINQDLLYTVDADQVDSKRLRDYIKFFSVANRVRNTAIEQIEIFYSNKILKKG